MVTLHSHRSSAEVRSNLRSHPRAAFFQTAPLAQQLERVEGGEPFEVLLPDQARAVRSRQAASSASSSEELHGGAETSSEGGEERVLRPDGACRVLLSADARRERPRAIHLPRLGGPGGTTGWPSASLVR
jgi:hypothetical protein